MSIYRRKSGRWAVRIDVDRRADGRRARLALGTFATRKEAERAEREALATKDRGIDLSPASVSVKTLLDRYVNERASLGRGAKTIEEYQRIADLYIAPHLGAIVISKLKPAMVSAWISTILERGGYAGGPISAKTARHAYALLNAAMRWGIRMEVVGRNVCEAVTPPTPKRTAAKSLTVEEIKALSSMARGTRWEAFIGIALMLGARRGEVLALTWRDVDLESGRVTIRASLAQTKGSVALKSTKTDRTRIVPIAESTRLAFRRQQAQQNTDRLSVGDAYQQDPSRPIFTDELGARVTPKAATNAFARLAKKAGISTTSLHSTRHTAATNLVRAGVDVRTVSSILGHSNASVTLGIYSHVVEGAERAAVELLEDRLEGALKGS